MDPCEHAAEMTLELQRLRTEKATAAQLPLYNNSTFYSCTDSLCLAMRECNHHSDRVRMQLHCADPARCTPTCACSRLSQQQRQVQALEWRWVGHLQVSCRRHPCSRCSCVVVFPKFVKLRIIRALDI
jgi:hypothetical protein